MSRLLHFVILFLTIGSTLWVMDFSFSPNSAATEEGHGINSGSRKYYEYLRLRDPKTGRVPVNMRQRELEFVSHLPKSNDRSLDWTHRGPFNIGGRTRAFALDVLNENTMLAGGVTGGMWKSTDGGSSWTKTTAMADIHSVSCVVQDTRPGHENTWYHGTGEESYGVVSGTSFSSLFSGNGIFKSTDNGSTWTALFSTVSNTPENTLQIGSYDFCWNMVIDHTNLLEEEVYAAVYSGIIRSTDGGGSWQQVLGFGSAGQEFTDIMITPQGVLYATLSFGNASNNGGYFRSADGITWTEITPTGITSQRRSVMCINPQNENEVYFLTEVIGTDLSNVGHTLFKYTYLSGDGSGAGGSWDDRSMNLPDGSCELFIGTDFEFETFRTQFSYDMCMAHHPTEPDMLYIGGININRSASAFANDDSEWIGGYRCNEAEPWFYVYPNHHPDQHLMVFSPSNPEVMYSANDGGLYKTSNASDASVTWTPLNHGYSNAQFYTVHMEQGHANSDFVFGGMQDNGTWITNNTVANQNWKELHSDDGAYGALPEGRAFVITSSQQGKIFKKTMDAEGNLTGTRRIDADQGPAALFINPLMLDPVNQVDLYLAGNRTIWQLPRVDTFLVNNDYLTEVDNDYWDNISESLIPVSHGSISCLDKAIADNTIIFYGTTVGKLWRLDNCFDAPVKSEITSDLFPEGAYMSCVTMHDFNVDEAIVSFSNYNIPSIFHTTDGGATFTDVSGNLEQFADGTGAGPAVYWVEIYPGDAPVYFAGTSSGLFSTNALDGSNTIWTLEGGDVIGNCVINMVDVRPFDGKIVVGTHGRGVFSSSMDPVEAAGVGTFYETTSDLNVYPNPFTDRIQFECELNTNSDVHLEIFDLRGKRISIERRQNLVPGKQIVVWKPLADLPRGSYLYTITWNGKSRSGKILYQ